MLERIIEKMEPFRVVFNGSEFSIRSWDYQTWYCDVGKCEATADAACENMTRGYEIALSQQDPEPGNRY